MELTTRVSIVSTIYEHTQILLPHDDQLDNRAFAYVYYLTPQWKPNYGGELALFDNGSYQFFSLLNLSNVLKFFQSRKI